MTPSRPAARSTRLTWITTVCWIATREGSDKAGQLILQNADAAMLPDWAYTLNQDLDWWVSGTGDLINAEGKKLVGANADGS